MKTRKIVALVLASMMAVSSLAACNNGKPTESSDSGNGGNGGGEPTQSQEIVDFTMFAAMAGKEKDANNDIKEIIAEKTGEGAKA